MSTWTGQDKITIKTKNKYEESEVELWENDKTGNMVITFSGMAWASEGIEKKTELKKVIKFLESNLAALK